MSNVFKKVVSVGLTMSTMLWSVGVSALLPMAAQAAACPTFKSGDMLKVTGKPAIYSVDSNGKVLYFPSGDEFKSWTVDDKYSGYTSISQECFDSLPVPSMAPFGVNFRPGSAVVKRASSDQLYVVEPGNKLAKITMEAAKALYGSTFKAKTVADVFWPNYGSERGPDVTEAKVHPGMLVSNGGKTWYVAADSKLREVTATGMTANRFKASNVHVATDAMISGLSFGDVISAEVSAVADRTQTGGGSTTLPGTVSTGSLTVSLASDNPFAATIVSDSTSGQGAQAMIPVLKLNFSAGSGEVKVTSLKLKRGGISADTDISNMYLFDGDTKLAANPSISNNVITFTNSAGLFTVASGASKAVTVKLDLKNQVSAGKTFTFSVAASSDVVSSGSTGGSFPIAGNTFTSAAVSDLGKLTLTNVSPTAAGTVDPGTTNFEIWRFTAAGSNQDVEIRRVSFTLVGSINPSDLKSLGLWDGAKQIGGTMELSTDKTVTFDLSAAPYVITKGQTKTLSLKADVVAGTTRTFYASIQNSGDVVTYDKNYGIFLKTNGTDTFTVVQAGGSSSVNWTINAGTLTQSVAPDAPTGNIPDGATNLTLAKFLWKANGEDIKVSSLSVSSTSPVSTTGNNTLSNVRLLVNGSQVGSTISSHTANGQADTGWGTFGNSFIVKAGTTATVTIVADTTHSSVAAGEGVVTGFVVGSSNAQGVVSLTNVSTVAQTGNTLTVRAGTVSVAKNSAFGDKTATNPSGTVNATQAKIASLVITAGSGEDVELSQVVLRDDNASTCIGTYVQNLTLKNAAGAQLGTTYANPSTTCTTQNTYTFNISPAVTIANGAQYVVDVYGDLKAALSTATSLIDANAITATGKITGSDASATSQNLSLQNQYVASAGALLVQVDSDTPVANNHLMGATDQTIGKFKLTASSTEAVNVTQLVLSSRFSTGATGTVTNIRLIDDSTGAQVGAAVPAFSDSVAGTSSATGTYAHATFSSLSFQIPKGSSKTLSLKADFTTYEGAGLSTTGQTVVPVILGIYTSTSGNNPVTANGASSGTSITATVTTANSNSVTGGLDVTNNGANATAAGSGAFGTTTTLYRAKLTTRWADDRTSDGGATPSGAAAPGAAQTVAKFVVTNLANSGSYTATVNLINFDLSSTISTTNNTRTLSVYKDNLTTTALASTNARNQNATGYLDTALTDGNFTDVDISSGASKMFYVTLDTTDAASAKSLSIRIGTSDVTWTDGVSTSLTVMGQDLPLVYKTFTY